MPVCTADFEAGIQGNTIATTDPGSATAWDAVRIDGGSTLTYDNTHSYGIRAASVTTNGVPVLVRWTTALGSQTDHYGRWYGYLTTILNAECWGIELGGLTCCYITTTAADLIQIRDASFSIQATSTTALPQNNWFRIEYHVVHSATVGQVEVKLFLSPDSTTETELIQTAASINTRASGDGFYIGASGPAGTRTFWLDNIVAGATAWPGPLTTIVAADVLSMQSHVFGHNMW